MTKLRVARASPGTPATLPQDQMLINLQSLYSSFLALQAKHADDGYDKAIASALKRESD